VLSAAVAGQQERDNGRDARATVAVPLPGACGARAQDLKQDVCDVLFLLCVLYLLLEHSWPSGASDPDGPRQVPRVATQPLDVRMASGCEKGSE
jgi:hypothetical protein